MLASLANISISPRHVGNLTHEIGAELLQARDQRAEDWLHHRRQPSALPVPQAVAVAVDGGFMQTRAEGQGPGVHEQGWKEDKVACLHTLQGPTFAEDPQPQPPDCFLDPHYVDDLVQDLKSHKRLSDNEDQAVDEAADPSFVLSAEAATAVPEAVSPLEVTAEQADASAVAAAEATVAEAVATEGCGPAAANSAAEVEWPPKRLVRTCVATQRSSAAFGPLVAQEAYARNFYASGRRAFLGDGQKYNWTIQQKWFKEFEAIADFVHPLSYLYVAATALASGLAERWELYEGWMTSCWQGRVASVLEDLKLRQESLGQVQEKSGQESGEEKPPGSEARVVVAKAVTYLENNQERMDYPRYRQQGLPITSCAVESLIKEFNYRVKGTEKSWNRPGGTETILTVRAAVLSGDDRLGKHIHNRPGSPFRRYGTNANDK